MGTLEYHKTYLYRPSLHTLSLTLFIRCSLQEKRLIFMDVKGNMTMDIHILFQGYLNSEYAQSFKLTEQEFEYLYQLSQSPFHLENHRVTSRDKTFMQAMNATTFPQLIKMFNRMIQIIQRRINGSFVNE